MAHDKVIGADRVVLTVDVGNTATSLGVFRGEALLGTWSLTTPEKLTADEAYAAVASAYSLMKQASVIPGETAAPTDSVLSCVVPDQSSAWQEALQRICGRRALTVGPGIKTGVKMRYRDPAKVGADRVADLAAVLKDYEGPVVVVDLGTTTNFEVIDEQGVFLGGIIAPGMALGARALAQAAAKLPVIETRAPESVIGTSTREAMQAGVVLGEVARIDGLLNMIEAEIGLDFTVVVTGTDAAAMAALLAHEAIADETLTLRGLARLYALNRR